jgi:hypothetical protein
MQSDPQDVGFQDQQTSRDVIDKYVLDTLDVPSDVLKCLRASSVSDIISAQNQIFSNGTSVDPFISYAVPIVPTIDGDTVKGDFANLLASESLPMSVPVIIGNS